MIEETTTELERQLLAERKRRIIDLAVLALAGRSEKTDGDVTADDIEAVLAKMERRERFLVADRECWNAYLGALWVINAPHGGIDGLLPPDAAYVWMKTYIELASQGVLRGGKVIFDDLLAGQWPDYWTQKIESENIDVWSIASPLADGMKDEHEDEAYWFTCPRCESHLFHEDLISGGYACSDCGRELEPPEVEDLHDRLAAAEPQNGAQANDEPPAGVTTPVDVSKPEKGPSRAPGEMPDPKTMAERLVKARGGFGPAFEEVSRRMAELEPEDVTGIRYYVEVNKAVAALQRDSLKREDERPEVDVKDEAERALKQAQAVEAMLPAVESSEVAAKAAVAAAAKVEADRAARAAKDSAQAEREPAREEQSKAASAPVSNVVELHPKDEPEAEGPRYTKSDGTKILIAEMGHMHLVNAHAAMRKRGEKGQFAPGEVDVYNALWDEIVKRELQVNASETRLALSPAKIGLAHKCGQAYFYRYEEGLKTPPSAASTTGKVVHRATELNLKRKLTSGRLMTVEEVADRAASEFEAQWGDVELKADSWEVEEAATKVAGYYKDAAVDAAVHHRTNIAPIIDITGVEVEFTLTPPEADFYIYGYVDQDTQSGARDLKTGKRFRSQEDADGSLQLTYYALKKAAKDKVPSPSLVLDSIKYTSKGVQHVSLETHRTRGDMERALTMADIVTKAIRMGTLLPARYLPGAWWCSKAWCGYYRICPYGERMGTKQD